MPDERIVLDYDPSEALAAAEKANRAIESNEKTAERAGVAIAKATDAQAQGISAVAERSAAAMQRMIASAQSKARLALDAGAAVISAAKLGISVVSTLNAQRGAIEKVADAWRAARLVVSPTIFTGAAVAVGVLAQATIRLTAAEAERVAVLARQSVFQNQAFEGYRLMSLSLGKLNIETDEYVAAGNRLQRSLDSIGRNGLAEFGVDLDLLRARGLKSADMLREIGAAAEGLNEFEKARLAVKLFGTDASANIGFLDGRVQRVRESFVKFGGVLSEVEARELLQFKQGVDAIGDAFGRMRDSAQGAIDGIRTRFSSMVAELSIDAYRRGKSLPQFGVKSGMFPEEGSEADRESRRGKAEFAEIAGGFAQNAISNLSPKVPSVGAAESGRLAREFRESLPGIQQALSEAISARSKALALVGTEKGALLGEGLAQELRARQTEVDTLTAKVNEMNAAVQEAEARRRQMERGIAKSREIMSQRAAGGFKVDVIKDLAESGLSEQYERQFQAAQKVSSDIADMELSNIRERLAQEEFLMDAGREKQLAQLEAFGARTLDEKLRMEERKADIERQYLLKSFELRARLLEIDQNRELAAAEQNAELRAAINAKYALAGRELTLRTELAMDAAQESAAVRKIQLVRSEQEKAFDTVRQAADGVFDALATRVRSLGDLLKVLILQPLLTMAKQISSTAIATILTGGNPNQGTGGAGLFARLGFGALTSGRIVSDGAPGGTPGFAGPVGGVSGTLGTVAGGQSGGAGGALGLAGLKANSLGLLSSLGNIGAPALGPGSSGGAQAGGGIYGAKGGAMLVGGGILAFDGLRRGGVVGLAETTAGGALIGAKFGGPMGALIGGAIGAAAGTVRLFIKGAHDKLKDKIQSMYGVRMADKALLGNILSTIKSSFGGDMEAGIRSPQIRDLIELYAMSTGQKYGGVSSQTAMAMVSQRNGMLTQIPQYGWSGQQLAGLGGAIAQGGVSAGAVTINLQLDGQATTRVMRGEAVQVVQDNPRLVAQAGANASRDNFRRRENTLLGLKPGLLST